MEKTLVEYWSSRWPKTITDDECFGLLMKGWSFLSYGDGEYRLCLGYAGGWGEKDDSLRGRLVDILKSQDDMKIMIGLWSPNYRTDYVFDWFCRWFGKVIALVGTDRTRAPFMKYNNRWDEWRKVWAGRKVCFVYSPFGRFVKEPRLFGNVAESADIEVPPLDVWSSYDRILAEARKFPKDWLFLISAGSTARVLAYDLAKDGYQAVDIGHLPNTFLYSLGEAPSPQELPWTRLRNNRT